MKKLISLFFIIVLLSGCGNNSAKGAVESYLKKYKDLAYEILDEEYDGDISYVKVKIKVYDLYQAQVDAKNYLDNNSNEFMTNGEYDENKYILYKLDKMQDTTNKIEYTITKTYTTTDMDFSYATRDTNGKREISLTTCTNDVNARLVIWAKED